MPKKCIEKPIVIDDVFPIDLWSVGIDLLTLKTIGPVRIMKTGTPMRDSNSYMFYTARTKKDMRKNGYAIYKIPENLIVLATTLNDCKRGFDIEAKKLVSTMETNIKTFKSQLAIVD